MRETMDQSPGILIGLRMSGTVDKADYAVLGSAMDAVVKSYGSVNLLIDLSDLH